MTVVNIMGYISIPKQSFCPNEAEVTLIGYPANGTFEGPGVVDDTFNPALSGSGNFTISYSLSIGGCSANSSIPVQVFNLPTPTIVGINTSIIQMCENDNPLILTGSPAGGQFTVDSDGTGYDTNTGQFIPLNATGRHDFSYTVVYPTGCVATTNFSIIVNALGVGSCEEASNTTDVSGSTQDSNSTKIDHIVTTAPFPVWGIALIIIGGLLLVAGIIIFLVLYIKKKSDKVPERIELNQINDDGTVSSVTATRDMILSTTK